MTKATKSQRPKVSRRKPKAEAFDEVEGSAAVQILENDDVLAELEVEQLVNDDESSGRTGKKKRKKLSRAELEENFDSILSLLAREIEQTQENKTRIIPVRTLNHIHKEAKKLKVATLRSVKKSAGEKIKNPSRRSGFDKPETLSKELLKFTKWPVNEKRSRVEVTKFLCDYIKTNELQNPEDRRQIFPDKALTKLLRLQPNEILYYYSLQKHIQPHFVKEQPIELAA